MISESTNKLTREQSCDLLRKLLAEGADKAVLRERAAFDAIAGSAPSLVLFGAGNLGRKVLAGLRSRGCEPVAFTDSNPRKWNTVLDGLKVLSPQDAAQAYGEQATFVITIFTGEGYDRMGQRIEQLRCLGCKRIASFAQLFWKYPEIFLPHYFMDLPHKVYEQADQVLQACRLWSDATSRQEYLAQVQFRLLGDFACLPNPVKHTTYFPPDLFSLIDGEVFVDCGAFDGDTIKSFFAQPHASGASIFAFEPDANNFSKLEKFVRGLPNEDKVKLQKAAVSSSRGTLSFCASGDEAAHVGSGGVVVDCVTLDEELASAKPTFIKMDIEGAELDALRGAAGVIREQSPVLAICSYHCQDHLWKIPTLIHSMNNGYRYFLRPHLLEGWDLVCYAIPENRLLPGRVQD